MNPLSEALSVVYFDQLLEAARTKKLVETLFSAVFNLFCSFQIFFSDFTAEMCFDQLLGARSTQKLVKIHNS